LEGILTTAFLKSNDFTKGKAIKEGDVVENFHFSHIENT
jgi:hypothetical protein